MKTLWLVKAYSHHHNQWTRFLVTASTPAQASSWVDADLGGLWKSEPAERICSTDHRVYLEI